MPGERPLPAVIGPAENALRALLTKLLSTTRIETYPAWVTLNAVSSAGATGIVGPWLADVADALKVAPSDVDDILADLRRAGLVHEAAALTARGASELEAARSVVAAATAHLVDGIGAEELATARFVLDRVRLKAEALLRA